MFGPTCLPLGSIEGNMDLEMIVIVASRLSVDGSSCLFIFCLGFEER